MPPAPSAPSMHEARVRDFSDVTEVPGLPVTSIQLARTYHRYEVARAYGRGKDVLEVACGAGQGIGYLAPDARSIVAGDLSASNLEMAARSHGGAAALVRLDAQALPFRDASFDVVLLLEAIYYLPDADRAIMECARVLRQGGRLVIATVNRAWPDFGRSIRSTRYLDSRELVTAMRARGLDVEMFGAFADAAGPVAAARSALRRGANRLGLVPGSLRAKAMLKRLFYGPLRPQPALLDPAARSTERMHPIAAGTLDTRHSILYAVGTRR